MSKPNAAAPLSFSTLCLLRSSRVSCSASLLWISRSAAGPFAQRLSRYKHAFTCMCTQHLSQTPGPCMVVTGTRLPRHVHRTGEEQSKSCHWHLRWRKMCRYALPVAACSVCCLTQQSQTRAVVEQCQNKRRGQVLAGDGTLLDHCCTTLSTGLQSQATALGQKQRMSCKQIQFCVLMLNSCC